MDSGTCITESYVLRYLAYEHSYLWDVFEVTHVITLGVHILDGTHDLNVQIVTQMYWAYVTRPPH